MSFWPILYVIDGILFVMVALTTLYMLFFAVASLFYHKSTIPKARHQNRFIILITSYKNPKVVQTVKSILGQTYPQRLFDVTVVSDHNDEMTNMRLAQEPITLLTPYFEESTKVKALQLGFNNLPQFKIYDVVIILESGNIVEQEFLDQINDAYESAGTKAIQVHRLSRNRDTTAARMGAIFEEINTSIFRRGHFAIGLSASLMTSGCAFDFTWFRNYVNQLKSNWVDKEMEAMLMRQHVFIDYFNNIFVYEEKIRQAEEFNRERGRWIKAQFITLIRNIKFLPGAIFNQHYNWIDKQFQWMLIPRMVMIPIIIAMGVLLPIVYMSLAFKWWILFAIVLLIFAMATPDYMVDEHWDSTFYKAPLVFMKSIPGLSKVAERIEDWEQKKAKKNKHN